MDAAAAAPIHAPEPTRPTPETGRPETDRGEAAASAEGAALRAEIAALCPDPGSRASRLCADGAAVELAFAWPGEDVRVTCDPAPGASPARRLEAALALCGGALRTEQAAQAALLGTWIDARARYGAWVGSRVRAGTPRRKLYLEIPEGSPWRAWPPGATLSAPDLPSRLLTPVMAGFDAASLGVEVYWRIPALHPDLLRIVLTRVGMPPAANALLAEIGRLTGRAVRDHLPGHDQGLSLAFGPAGEVRAVTWYGHAERLLGPPERARSALRQAGLAAGWPMRRYAAASAPDAAGAVACHGFAGLRLGADGTIATSITLSWRSGTVP